MGDPIKTIVGWFLVFLFGGMNILRMFWNDMDDKDVRRVAMVRRRKDGRWEVLVAQDYGDDCLQWRHKRMFWTEQQAEIYARSLLPYCDDAWKDPGNHPLDERLAMIPRPVRTHRRLKHESEA